jgi:cellulose synthase/poly-beta-1,6-N-acetylglucosamine synthase-like glycosyltransferase
MSSPDVLVVGLYFAVLVGLSVYGAHRVYLLYLYTNGRPSGRRQPACERARTASPRVTVQLPVFNEVYVIERLIEAVARLRYPRDRFEVQVLDDSTDETGHVARAAVDRWRARGLAISYRQRADRAGFKAGALAEGLRLATGELIAVFDADFMPPPDFLERAVGVFADERVGLVQARWGHANRRYSLLTRLQALLLDGHFVLEHGGRHRGGCFFNFNGTAGIWRRAAIESAGGWQHDTLTEDLDLSYRAQLAGWRFVFLPDVVAPAELPVEMSAFKSQQHRWAKGSIQTCRKVLPAVLRADVPIWRRAAIESAGGWQHDTLTEDLDLSYRAQLAGWRFVFLPDVVAPAELPVEMSAFKSQQHRWAKGSIQTCRKVLPAVLRADVPLRVKAEAFLHLTANFNYLLVLALCVLIVPALVARTATVGGQRLLLVDAALFGLAAVSVVTFYAVSQREIGGRWWARLRDLPAMIALGLGLSLNNALAVVEALSGRTGEFRRTPKYGERSRDERVVRGRRPRGARVQPLVEIAFGTWFTLAIAYALATGVYGAVPFLALFQIGFFYAGFASRAPRYEAGPAEGLAGGGTP